MTPSSLKSVHGLAQLTSGKQPNNVVKLCALSFLLLAVLLSKAILCAAQVQNVTDVESTPIPGAGHNYLGTLNETVNPANGSLSIRISADVPKGRGLTLPFSFSYDSNGAVNINLNGPTGAPPLFQLGWSYSVPMLTYQEQDLRLPWEGEKTLCPIFTGYVFYDTEGNRHALNYGVGGGTEGLIWSTFNNQAPCPSTNLTGGDPVVSAKLTDAATVAIQDASGTTYTLVSGATSGSATVEDRNGNIVQYAYNGGVVSASDTAGRAVLSTTGFGGSGTNSVTVAGLGNPFTLNWGTTASWNYSLGLGAAVYIPSGVTCSPVNLNGAPNGSSATLYSLTLPNGQSYKFYYDSTYGLIKEILYPTGAWVKYTWGINTNSEMTQGPGTTTDGQPSFCYYLFSSPVITQRQVSYDGTHVAETQTFQYATSWGTSGINKAKWTTKGTTVTTTDNVRSGSFTTVYTYTPVSIPVPPNSLSTMGPQVPVEYEVQHNNWNGSLLRTDYKWWANPYLMTEQQTVLAPSSLASQVNYMYGNLAVVKEKDEYDYGQSSITRSTVTNYQAFSANVLGSVIYDRPCQTIVYAGSPSSGTRTAETDYFYDSGGAGTVCGTAGTPVVSNAGGSSLTGHDETNYGVGSPATPRGNLTTVINQCFPSGSCAAGNPTTTYTYDETGQPTTMTDPNQNLTKYGFSDNYVSTNTGGYTTTAGSPPSGEVTNAFLTKLTNALQQTSTFTYGYNDGELTTVTDPNSQLTRYRYNDNFDRPTETDYPDGGQKMIAYVDSSPVSVTTCSLISGTAGATCSAASPPSGWKTTEEIEDGLGHTIETALVSDPDGTTYTATTYDGEDKPYTVTNPYRSTGDPTYGVTTYTYDTLGRPTTVSEPDGSAVSTSYSNNQTTVTDEVGNQRTSTSDSFGRLTAVAEAPNNSSYNYSTSYAYDTLNDLTGVTQNGSSPSYARIRSFSYDSLARLYSATNPESGTITYTYDANSNLLSKTAPQPNQTGSATVITNYTYDALNRLTQKSYVNMTLPKSKFGYDGTTLTGCGQDPPVITSPTNLIGRRSAMCDGQSGSSWSFDPVGRPLLESRYNSGNNQSKLNVNYAYYLDGSLKTLTYPSGDLVTYTVGGAGRATMLSDSTNNYVGYSGSPASYVPQGALASMLNGYTSSPSFAGIATSNVYSDRLQPVLLSATVGSGTIFSLCYDFHLGVAISSGPCQLSAYTTGDNGNVYQVLDNYDSTRSAAYIYDPLNRIAQAYTTNETSGNCWGETYASAATAPGVLPSASNSGIDAWSNLTNRSGVSGMGGCLTEGLSTTANTNNQLGGLAYDAAGNVTNDGNGNQPTYDAENRIATDAGVNYFYDADVFRMEKSSGTMYWPGPGGEVLCETNLNGTINEEYIYFAGRRIARVDRPSGAVHYYFSDNLGSTGLVTDDQGNVQEREYFYPFGGIVSTVGSDSNHYKFTGKERDSESGLDMFGARYYGSSLGRFMTPDWAAKPVSVPYAHFGNPQSLNLYSYVENNPTTVGDPDGHDTEAEKQAKIAAAAAAQKGSDAYDIKKTNISNMQVFKNGSDKCNEFVSDTVKSADGTRPVVDGTGKVPTASQFADPNVKITGLSAPDPMSNAKPGDVVAQDHGPNPNTGNEEGHVGIIVALPHDGQPGQTASANANQGGQVTVNDWGFRSPTANPNNGERNGASSPAPVVRHPLGDPQ